MSSQGPNFSDSPQSAQQPLREARPLPEAIKRSQGKEPPAYTEMLAIRPPEEEVERRTTERSQAAKVRPVLPRIWQVVVAVCFPVLLLAAAVRLVVSPLFLWAEYSRPGFPANRFGFSSNDRLNYGSYVVDYLNNLAAPQYLGDLVGRDDRPLFSGSEVSYLADIKMVYALSMLVSFLLLVVFSIGVIYLMRRSVCAVRPALFAGSIAVLVIMLGVAVLTVTGWDSFVTGLQQIFFAAGSWPLAEMDALIQLFPGQFWLDAGLSIAVMMILVASVVFALTWPTRRRRRLSEETRRRSQGRRAAI